MQNEILFAILGFLISSVVCLYIGQWRLIRQRKEYDQEIDRIKLDGYHLLTELSQEVSYYRTENTRKDSTPKI